MRDGDEDEREIVRHDYGNDTEINGLLPVSPALVSGEDPNYYGELIDGYWDMRDN